MISPGSTGLPPSGWIVRTSPGRTAGNMLEPLTPRRIARVSLLAESQTATTPSAAVFIITGSSTADLCLVCFLGRMWRTRTFRMLTPRRCLSARQRRGLEHRPPMESRLHIRPAPGGGLLCDFTNLPLIPNVLPFHRHSNTPPLAPSSPFLRGDPTPRSPGF